MIRRPPISTRTHTLFPYPTLFRSCPELLDPCLGELGLDAMLDRSVRRPILEILGIGFRIIGNTIAGGDLRVWHHDLVVKVEIGVNVAERSEAEIEIGRAHV